MGLANLGISGGQIIGVIWGAETIDDIEGDGGFFYGGGGGKAIPGLPVSIGVTLDLITPPKNIVNNDPIGIQLGGNVGLWITTESTREVLPIRKIYGKKTI